MLVPSGTTATGFLATLFPLPGWYVAGERLGYSNNCVGAASEEICQRIVKLPRRGSRGPTVILFHPGPFTEWAPALPLNRFSANQEGKCAQLTLELEVSRDSFSH